MALPQPLHRVVVVEACVGPCRDHCRRSWDQPEVEYAVHHVAVLLAVAQHELLHGDEGLPDVRALAVLRLAALSSSSTLLSCLLLVSF
eukprot:5695114-Pyramimonas_sp.AAC.1